MHSIWLKSEKGTNILWLELGKRSHGNGKWNWSPNATYEWLPNLQPNLRTQIIRNRSISGSSSVDALVVTHIHSDHLDINTAAAVANNCPEAKFVGPQEVVNTWLGWEFLLNVQRCTPRRLS